MVKSVFSARDLRSSTPIKSSAMKKMMSNPKIAKVLDKTSERRQLLGALKKHGGSKQGVRKALGELSQESNALSRKELSTIGKELGLGKKRFITSSEKRNSPAQNTPTQTAPTQLATKASEKPNDSKITLAQGVAGSQTQSNANNLDLIEGAENQSADPSESGEASRNLWTVLNENTK